ncbi:MAG: DUF47 family protein [Nitrososphaerota archaeon]|nr:DUF47 domain-containing protein [Candidatus Bathyarchaeota archaeon]MDW8193758.1 DUF47 family protein [Nitrososphaerota archaeon]
MEKRSYIWFERRRRTRALELAQEQISKALDTVNFLKNAARELVEGDKKEAMRQVENIFKVEKEVDTLRTEVFKELSKGVALFAEYREDLMHLVKRLDTFADHVKDAGRCIMMLEEANIPEALWEKVAFMTLVLVDCAQALRESIEKIADDPAGAIKGAKRVEDVEKKLDDEYLNAKKLFIKYGGEVNSGALVIFNNLVEFIEHAADMCADTADYIVILSSRE